MTRNNINYGPRKTPFHQRVIVIPMWALGLMVFVALVCAQIGYKAHHDSVMIHSEVNRG